MEDKLNQVMTDNKSYAESLSINTQSEGSHVNAGSSGGIREIMLQTKNEELVQERERKLRSANVIIHGVKEDGENIKEKDEEYVKEFIGKLGLDLIPESIVRLGKMDSNKVRPMKLRFKSENDKDNVMARLPNLKNAEDHLKQISVTDDYTVEERLEKWLKRLKRRTATKPKRLYGRLVEPQKTG